MDMTQKKTAAFPVVIKTDDNDTVRWMFENDSNQKKKSIYHKPPTGKRYQEPKVIEYDEYKITLGYPMTFAEYSVLSDSTRKIYIESILDSYPGISINTIAGMLCTGVNTVKKEFSRLDIAVPTGTSRNLQSKYSADIKRINDKIIAGELPRNLVYNGGNGGGINDLKRIKYETLKKMTKEEARAYIMDVYNKYSRCLSIGDFSNLIAASPATTSKFLKSLEVNIGNVSKGFSRSKNSEQIRERFCKEMLPENTDVGTTKGDGLDYSVIDITITIDVDKTDINKIIRSFGVSGKVKLSIKTEI